MARLVRKSEAFWTTWNVRWAALHPPPHPTPVAAPSGIPEVPQPPPLVDIGLLAQPMDNQYDTTVALENAATTTVMTGNQVEVDGEVMSVTDAADQNNLVVTRGAPAFAHSAGAVVYIR